MRKNWELTEHLLHNKEQKDQIENGRRDGYIVMEGTSPPTKQPTEGRDIFRDLDTDSLPQDIEKATL